MAWMLEVNYSITILIITTNALIVIIFLLLDLMGFTGISNTSNKL